MDRKRKRAKKRYRPCLSFLNMNTKFFKYRIIFNRKKSVFMHKKPNLCLCPSLSAIASPHFVWFINSHPGSSHTNSNHSLYTLYYAQAHNEFSRPISASLGLRATQLPSMKYCSGSKPLATLCSIWPDRDLILIPTAPETNALPFDQLAGFFLRDYLGLLLIACYIVEPSDHLPLCLICKIKTHCILCVGFGAVVPIYVEHWGDNLQFHPNFSPFSTLGRWSSTTIVFT